MYMYLITFLNDSNWAIVLVKANLDVCTGITCAKSNRYMCAHLDIRALDLGTGEIVAVKKLILENGELDEEIMVCLRT